MLLFNDIKPHDQWQHVIFGVSIGAYGIRFDVRPTPSQKILEIYFNLCRSSYSDKIRTSLRSLGTD